MPNGSAVSTAGARSAARPATISRARVGPRAGVTDRSLVERSARGDRDAFGELVRRYLPAAHAAAAAIVGEPADADDVCQDAFVSALVHIDGFDPGRNFLPWLLQIVKHRAFDLRRRQRVRATEVLGSGAGEYDRPAPARERPDAYAERNELRQRIARGTMTLVEPYRSVLVLHDLEGLTHGEIGAMLGCAEGTSRHHLFVARRLMRGQLCRDLLADIPCRTSAITYDGRRGVRHRLDSVAAVGP